MSDVDDIEMLDIDEEYLELNPGAEEELIKKAEEVDKTMCLKIVYDNIMFKYMVPKNITLFTVSFYSFKYNHFSLLGNLLSQIFPITK